MEQRNNQMGGSHFTEQQWSDFVRGLRSETDRLKMQTHLDSGCQKCGGIAGRLRAVAELGESDAALDIRPEAIRRARAILEPAGPSPWIEALTPIVAELVSSFRSDWQLAGVRSVGGPSAGDRALFRAGDYSVDLELDPPLAGEAGEIVGQIANERDQGERLEGVLVQMMSTGRTLGETSTNRFGEFLMDYPAEKSVTIRFALKHRGQRIDLPLTLARP